MAKLRPPHFWTSTFPQDEQDVVHVIRQGLDNLAKYHEDFHAAVRLFDYCKAKGDIVRPPKAPDSLVWDDPAFVEYREACRRQEQSVKDYGERGELLSSWVWMASKFGAITLYHFGIVLQGLREGLGRSPTLRGLVDHSKMRAARKQFDAYFPNAESMRHAVAHEAELFLNEKATERNALKGPDYDDGMISIKGARGPITLSNILANRTYSTGHEGKMLRYEVDHSSVGQLREVCEMVFSAFAAVEGSRRRR